MSPPWLPRLINALDLEYARRPRIAALATVDPDGHPTVRHVVCRRIGDDGAAVIVSDARSQKNRHLRALPFAELAFWLPTRREQFRLAGRVRLITAADGDPVRETTWRELSDESRALFTWPAPGQPRPDCDDQFAPKIAADFPIPDSFELILLSPDHVEHLALTEHPHRRTRWRAETAWEPESINP
jgi:PPOX class probable FMN-dependent enzyme